jgi:hypothetical protein
LNQDISWDAFCEYSEIINRLFIQDIKILERIYEEEKVPDMNISEAYRLDRLESLGLIRVGYDGMLVTEDAPEEGISECGKKFTKIILNK